MSARRIAAPALATALALGIAVRPAEALTIAQITRHGYVLVDEPNAQQPYEGSAGAASSLNFASFIADVTGVIDAAGGPHADYIAVMQAAPERSVVAFYARIRNQTRGVGDHSPQGGAAETYDLNPAYGTVFPIGGALFLNQPGFYTSAGFSDYGTQIICPQEFGHRFLAQVHIPPVPGMHTPDAGMIDASTTDVTDPDADVDATVTDGDLPDVSAIDDAGNPDVPPPPMPIAVDSLLGRQSAHWSYFVNSGGSPVEGNSWSEITPGVFRTNQVPIRFSQLDLYLMGLIPASAVDPFFVIAEPDVMGQFDTNGMVINRASPPESFGFGPRNVTIHGRRVTYTIEDVIQTNGPRVPAYSPPDAGAPDGGRETSVTEMRVIWVLLTTSDAIDSRTARGFDQAIEACSMGYATATGGLARLVPVVLPQPADAGTDSGVHTMGTDASVADSFIAPRITAGGGCNCRVAGPVAPRGNGVLALSGLAAGLAWSLRRRRTRVRLAA